MRRFALPLALSLAAHAGLLALLLVLPAFFRGERPPRRGGGGGTLSLSIALVSTPRQPAPRARKAEQEEWMAADVEPVLVRAGANADALPLPPPLAGEGGGGSAASAAPGVGPGGPEGPAGSAVLPLGQRVRRVVYLLDRSISMSQHGALARARRELALSLRALPADTHFQVLAYNRTVTPLPPSAFGLAAANPAVVEQTIDAVERLAPSGGTDHVAALSRGLALRPEVLFLITDADDLREADVATVRQRNRSGTAIHVVELSRGGGQADGPLAHLAAATGGSYRRVHPGR